MYAKLALRDAALLLLTLLVWRSDAALRVEAGPLAAALAVLAGALAVLATAILELPPFWRVLRGGRIPRGLGYRTSDVAA